MGVLNQTKRLKIMRKVLKVASAVILVLIFSFCDVDSGRYNGKIITDIKDKTVFLSVQEEIKSPDESKIPEEERLQEEPTEENTPQTNPQNDRSSQNNEPDGDGVKSKYAYLISLSDSEVLYSKKGTERIYPASMTKIMTLLVACENIEDFSEKAKVTSENIKICTSRGASVAGLKRNEEMALYDLLYGLILPSGADAAIAIADKVAGSEKEFAELMNKKAKELGLKDTHFTNCTGLNGKKHYSTPQDIAVIFKAALENPLCKKVLSASYYKTEPTDMHEDGIELESLAHWRVSEFNVPDMKIVAAKTGYTNLSGHCLASYAVRDDGKEYILITAKAKNIGFPPVDAEYIYGKYCSHSAQ